MNPLVSPITAGALDAPNRVWMAPLTRSRARMPGNIPWEMNAEYYAQRADPRTGAGVIISEATPVSPRGHGYYATPGIHTREQAEGWRLVTDAVHERGGLIVCQLWHVGRVSHSALQPNNERPVGPTDARSMSKTYLDHTMERVDNSEPRALLDEEVPGVVEEFRSATALARDAGFDGVEIHGANTYLLDQFTRDGSNRRTDAYGGPIENRLRFPLEVARAVADVIGADRTGYRISPVNGFNSMSDRDPAATFAALGRELGALGFAFLEAAEIGEDQGLARSASDAALAAFRDAGGGARVVNSGYTPASAEARLAAGGADAVAFGKLSIANPDLAERIAQGAGLNEPNPDTFYSGTAEGYTDYPALAASNA
jgi:N-ethylmaleimide reductase